MKKLLSLLLVAGMLLTGCGGSDSGKDEGNEKEKLVVGMECNYTPFNWTEPQENEFTVPISNGGGYADGYDVQIAKMVAEELGMELEIKKISWDGLIPALGAGDIDMIIAGMTANPEREEGADFTSPYYESEMIMVVRKDDALANATSIQDFSGKTVVGQLGTNYDDVIEQIKGVNHATPRKDYPSMVYALQQGEVDGITAEVPVAQGVIEANPDLTMVRFAEGKGFVMDTTISIALKEGARDSDLYNQVEEILKKLSVDDRNDLMAEVTKRQPAGE